MTAEIREGIDYILDNPTLRTAILFWGATSIVIAPFVTALAVHVTRDLGDEASILGLILVGYGVGTVGGSLFAGHQMRRGRVAVILVGWNLVMAVGLVAMAATEAIPIQVAAAVVTGFAQSMVLVTYLTLRTAVLARRPAGPGREDVTDDLARAPADRSARRRRAHRPDQRFGDDRRHRHRGRGCQPRLRAGPVPAPGVTRAAMSRPCQAARAIGSVVGCGASSTRIDAVGALERVVGDIDRRRSVAPWTLDT